MEKIRDLKNTQLQSAAKRQKISNDITIVTNEDTGVLVFAHVMQYLHCQRIYLNTLSVAGQQFVTSEINKNPASNAALEVAFAPYCECEGYRSHCEERVLVFLTRHPTVTQSHSPMWLRQADESTRTKAMELVRGEPHYTIGEALPKSLQECAHEWAIPLATNEQNYHDKVRQQQQSSAPATPPPSQMVQGGAVPESPVKTKAPTVSVTSSGRRVCKKWNDGRGCSSPCIDGNEHVCDIQIAPGKGCEVSGHTRLKHPFRRL